MNDEKNELSPEEQKKMAEEREEEFHQKYLRRYHQYQRIFSKIEQDGKLQKDHLHAELSEKATVNRVLRDNLASKEAQKRKL